MNRKAVHKKRISLKRKELRIKYTGMIQPVANILQGMTRRSKELKHVKKLTTKQKFKDLYNLLSNENLLVQAYGNIKSNAGSMTSIAGPAASLPAGSYRTGCFAAGKHPFPYP